MPKVWQNRMTGEQIMLNPDHDIDDPQSQQYIPVSPMRAEAARLKPWQAAIMGVEETGANVRDFLKGDQQALESREANMAPVRDYNLAAVGVGNAAPYVALGGPMGALRGASGIAARGIAEGTLSALDWNPHQSATERALWGAGGSVGGDMAGRVGARLTSYADRLPGGQGARRAAGITEQARQTPSQGGRTNYAENLQDAGGVLTPRMASGMNALDDIEGAFESNVMSSGIGRGMRERNQRLIMEQIEEGLGVPAADRVGRLDPTTRGMAKRAIGGRYDDLLAEAEDVYIPGGPGADVIRSQLSSKQAKQALENAGVVIPETGGFTLRSSDYRKLKSQMAADSMRKQNPWKRENMDNAWSAMDDAFEQANPTLVEPYRQVDAQYRLMKTIESGSAIGADGIIREASLLSKLGRGYPNLVNYGQGAGPSDLINTVQAAQATQALPFGNSGTVNRNVLGQAAGAIPAAVGASPYYSNPTGRGLLGITSGIGASEQERLQAELEGLLSSR